MRCRMLRSCLSGQMQHLPSRAPRTYSCEEIANGYIFFDWFAIPQITARKQGPSDCVVTQRVREWKVHAGAAKAFHEPMASAKL